MLRRIYGRLAWACSVLALGQTLSAATFVVTNTSDNSAGSLRQAIADANAHAGADVIEFAIPGDGPHTIALTAGTHNITSDITIDGTSQPGFETGVHQIVVSGNNQFRVFDVSGMFELSGLTITGGRSDVGGGMSINPGSAVTLFNCAIIGNRAMKAGGGIYSQLSQLRMNNCTVVSNRNYADSPTLRGAGLNVSGTLDMTECTIRENSGFGYGGGGIINFGTATIVNCRIESNFYVGPGSGVYNQGIMTIVGSTISGNIAEGSFGVGAGLFNDGSSLVLANCTVSGNTAFGYFEGGGGGILNQTGTLQVTSSTVSGNAIGGTIPFAQGGGISISFGRLTLNKTIVANSKVLGESRGDCLRGLGAVVLDNGFNIIADGSCLAHPTSIAGDPLLGPLADNGGITMTHALLAGSPAIDAGECLGGTGTTDQRGALRPQGHGCDIGAIETPDTDNDGVVDVNDNCPLMANADQTNNDDDMEGDVCDGDDDNDGVPDAVDNCPLVFNPDQFNTDMDPIGAACDDDDDNDGVDDGDDNCPPFFNPDQSNNDGDLLGDECDLDDDNDNIADSKDNCPFAANADQENHDDDVEGDACDLDDDNDGLPDAEEECPLDALKSLAGKCGCGVPDDDSDGDSLVDCLDMCPTIPSAQPSGCPALCDDGDGDGVCNDADNCPTVANIAQTDGDNDGVGDVCDNCLDVANSDQDDADADGVGDLCTPIPSAQVSDTDGDGVLDHVDVCPDTPDGTEVGADGCPIVVDPSDTDGDGVADDIDNCPDISNAEQADGDDDGIGDACAETADNEPGQEVPTATGTGEMGPICGNGLCGAMSVIPLWPIFLGLCAMRRRRKTSYD